MRLVCPNCDAEYEVDAAAIPEAGRDVQCSNCGHAWFQAHPEVEAEAEAAVAKAEVVAEAESEAEAVVEPEPVSQPMVEPQVLAVEEPEVLAGEVPEEEPALAAAPPMRSLDETVLAVLREEAEREAAARRAEAGPPRAPGLETQTEMPLAQDQNSMAAAVRRIARLRGAEPEPAPPPVPKSRREMLPAIEDINSTLRATSDRSSDEETAIFDTMAESDAASGGFRRGFLILVLIAVILLALYVFAPLIAAKVPALAGVAAGYVTAVNAARVWLDAELRALIAALRGLAGGQGG